MLCAIFKAFNLVRIYATIRDVSEISEIPENPENFLRKPVGRNFREFREMFSGDSREFRKSGGTFPEIWGFFPERALWNSVHVGKTWWKSRKIRVFSEKSLREIPGKSPGKSPGNPRKKRAFFSCFFRVRAKIQPISEKYSGKIPPENSPISGKFFPGKSPESPKIPEISGKKGSKMPVFGKIDPLLHTGF